MASGNKKTRPVKRLHLTENNLECPHSSPVMQNKKSLGPGAVFVNQCRDSRTSWRKDLHCCWAI